MSIVIQATPTNYLNCAYAAIIGLMLAVWLVHLMFVIVIVDV